MERIGAAPRGAATRQICSAVQRSTEFGTVQCRSRAQVSQLSLHYCKVCACSACERE